MSTISEKLTQLNTIKGDIKTAINNKGGEVGNDFSTYATAINNLSTGSGGSGETHVNPDFYELRTQNGTNFNGLFSKYSGPCIDVSNLDTSTVTDLSYAFYCYECTNVIGINKWDVSNVAYVDFMFNNSDMTSIDLSGMDFSKISSTSYMFGSCKKLTSINISGWKIPNVYAINNMFTNCSQLITVTGPLDLSNLTNGFYSASWNNPVNRCSKLETLYLKNIYKNCTMTNDSKWCINLSSTKVKDECLISIISELPDLINDKGLTDTSNIVLTLPPANTLTVEQVQVAIDKGWSVANTTY